jgi:carboxypeptidase PM20D1
MFDTLSREMGFGMRMLFANRWLTESVIVKVLEKNEPLLPMMHTTTALTMVQSGVKSNVMPTVATAVVNFRVLPGDTIEAVTEHARTVIDNPAVEVSIRGHDGITGNPSPISNPQAPAYEIVEKTIRQVFPDVVVAPGLVMGGTDSKHFVGVSDNIYRFVPFRIDRENVNSVHGINERIAVGDYLGIVAFYAQLMQNAAG